MRKTLLSLHTGDLILVNRRFPAVGEPEDLTDLGNGVLLARPAAQALEALLAAVNAGPSVTPVSGWRSQQEQTEIFDQSLRDSGRAFTEQYVAFPGHSEHQTGLAIDLGLTLPEIDFIRPAFPYSGICQAVRQRAAEFGFVERYPAGKEAITGISHEPWHFRYVGVPHAVLMTQRGWTLEEYHEAVKQYPLGGSGLPCQTQGRQYTIYYIPADAAGGLELEAGENCHLSGDNEGGLILTTWKEGR